MKQLITGFSLAAISAVVTTTAFAESGQGIGRAGTYQVQTQTQTQANAGDTPKSRAQVRAELAAAFSNGSLPALNRNTYPERSMWGDAIAAQSEQRARDAAQAEARNREIVEYANGSAAGNVTAR